MKLRRYSANGTTHNKGIAATLRVIWVVAPRSRLEGINARTIHRTSVLVGKGVRGTLACESRSVAVCVPLVVWSCQTNHAQTPMRTTNAPYPKLQSVVCASRCVPLSGSHGSINNGYPSSASMLPALLAAYRKYGSPAEG